MVETITIAGPLEPSRLGWISDLYGRADTKYRRRDILEHLFARSPAGPALHAFALDDGRAVGHCAVVPMPGRYGSEELRCGKLEGLFVDEAFRGRRAGEEPVVLSMLDRLYAFADEHGIDPLHAYVRPEVGRVIRFLPLGVGRRSLVAVVTPSSLPEPSSRVRAVAAAQRALRELSYAVVRTAARRRVGETLRAPTPGDADLVEAPQPPRGRWTVLGGDAWDWYSASPLLRVLELPSPNGCRALVQLPGAPADPVRVIGWRPERAGLLPAVLLLGAAGRLARRTGAATLRFQPWASPAGDGTLERACRLLGFVPRLDLTTLWVRSAQRALTNADAVVATPLFYLGF